ncbi:hypothetical protein [Pseudomonas chlororaphis]|uniref:Lipoprotein n=1 Tax=Pseudomonas chlororaphis TaxID=587753 RepID=A0A1Q8EPI6_9PSED|nr:hypothetical protein [Pseudomonas chlororaphis]OLF53707.1 hypothetical protein BTN82_15685 [Pseudomonas chlororaphis]
MNKKQRYGVGLVLALAAVGAMAEDLPQQSILHRYGVTPDQLPLEAPGKAPEPEPQSLFKIPAEGAGNSLYHVDPNRPGANVTRGDGNEPESTGNISIDNAAAREFERCQQVRSQLQKRGEQRYISCDNSVPGQSATPWSR